MLFDKPIFMISSTLLISTYHENSHDIIKVAKLYNGAVYHLDADILCRQGSVDSIYSGRVVERTPTLCFVDIGLSRPGILKKEPAFQWPHIGETVYVQITREAFYDPAEVLWQGKKGVHLSQNIALFHQTCLYQPFKKPSIIKRRPAATLPPEELAKHLHTQSTFLQAQWEQAAGTSPPSSAIGLILKAPTIWERSLRDADDEISEIYFDDPITLRKAREYCQIYRPDLTEKCTLATLNQRPLFAHFGVDEAYSSCMDTLVYTDDGSVLIFETTACVTTIDINPGRLNEEQSNLSVILPLAQQLKWRHISGNVLIDFIASGNTSLHNGCKNRKIIIEKLESALCDDWPSWKILGWSRQGMLELHRPKKRIPLNQRIPSL